MKTCCLFFAAVLLLLQSCSKHEGIPTESTYTFANHVGERITFDVYGSDTDYYQNAHRLIRYSIPKDSSQAMTLDVGKTYWVDWYNADYSRSNWHPVSSSYDSSTPLIRFPATLSPEIVPIISPLRDTMRSVLLNGGAGTISRWAGYSVDTSNDTTRYWLSVSKDLTCRMTSKHSSADADSGASNNFTLQRCKVAIDGTPTGFAMETQGPSQSPQIGVDWGKYYPTYESEDRDVLYMSIILTWGTIRLTRQ